MTELLVRASCMSLITETARWMGTIYGRVRVQKAMYLLKRLGARELNGVSFSLQQYGPFSSLIAEALAEAIQSGLVVETAKSLTDDHQQYEYSLGSGADTAAKVSPESTTLVKMLAGRLQNEHWRTLELSSTIDFLGQTMHLDEEQACAHAIELKPACMKFKEQALRLLRDLQLPTSKSKESAHSGDLQEAYSAAL